MASYPPVPWHTRGHWPTSPMEKRSPTGVVCWRTIAYPSSRPTLKLRFPDWVGVAFMIGGIPFGGGKIKCAFDPNSIFGTRYDREQHLLRSGN